eukprot:Rhum_TRINITY_DN14559_c9_g1::Rhum_TRINITY_DN14559_c9_g1_i1::g.98599::m.98599
MGCGCSSGTADAQSNSETSSAVRGSAPAVPPIRASRRRGGKGEGRGIRGDHDTDNDGALEITCVRGSGTDDDDGASSRGGGGGYAAALRAKLERHTAGGDSDVGGDGNDVVGGGSGEDWPRLLERTERDEALCRCSLSHTELCLRAVAHACCLSAEEEVARGSLAAAFASDLAAAVREAEEAAAAAAEAAAAEAAVDAAFARQQEQMRTAVLPPVSARRAGAPVSPAAAAVSPPLPAWSPERERQESLAYAKVLGSPVADNRSPLLGGGLGGLPPIGAAF